MLLEVGGSEDKGIMDLELTVPATITISCRNCCHRRAPVAAMMTAERIKLNNNREEQRKNSSPRQSGGQECQRNKKNAGPSDPEMVRAAVARSSLWLGMSHVTQGGEFVDASRRVSLTSD